MFICDLVEVLRKGKQGEMMDKRLITETSAIVLIALTVLLTVLSSLAIAKPECVSLRGCKPDSNDSSTTTTTTTTIGSQNQNQNHDPEDVPRGMTPFNATISASTVAEGFNVSKDNAWNVKDRVYTGNFNSTQLGNGTISIVENFRLSKNDKNKNDGEDSGYMTVYFSQPNTLGLKQVYAKFNEKLNYDTNNAGTLDLSGKLEILHAVDSSNNPVRIVGRGSYNGTVSAGHLILNISGFYKLPS